MIVPMYNTSMSRYRNSSLTLSRYNAEVAPPEVRGALVGLQQLAITLGILVSFWIDYGRSKQIQSLNQY